MPVNFIIVHSANGWKWSLAAWGWCFISTDRFHFQDQTVKSQMKTCKSPVVTPVDVSTAVIPLLAEPMKGPDSGVPFRKDCKKRAWI